MTTIFSIRTLVSAWVLPLAVLSGCAHQAASPDAEVQRAWVQHTADQGLQVRAITGASACPSMRLVEGSTVAMKVRAPAAVVPKRGGSAQSDAKETAFPVLVCEAAWPAGSAGVQVGPFALAAPRTDVRRIVLIGDTGCRLKGSEKAYQDCNDAADWPFAAVARRAAAMRPDLVIHVGDYHYRESPCAAKRAGCAGSPWGYGHDVWDADFFQPAAALLAAAPWVFVRGNHESCARAGQGWFRFLDARPWAESTSCNDPALDAAADFTPPFAVAIAPNTQLINFDSSRVANKAYGTQDRAFGVYAAQLAQVAELARQKPHSLFLAHHPVLAYFPGRSPGDPPESAGEGLRSVMLAAEPRRLLPQGIDTLINGHVHSFQALGFSSGHPSTLVVGNSGSQMEGVVNQQAGRAGQPAPGAVLETFVTQPGYGFATLDRLGDNWRLSEWSVGGALLFTCNLQGAQLRCDGPQP